MRTAPVKASRKASTAPPTVCVITPPPVPGDLVFDERLHHNKDDYKGLVASVAALRDGADAEQRDVVAVGTPCLIGGVWSGVCRGCRSTFRRSSIRRSS